MIEPHSSEPSSANFDREAVATRQRAMVEAGTHPMIADRLARDATQNQTLRERQIKLTATVTREPVVATEPTVVPEAAPIGAAHDRPDLHV